MSRRARRALGGCRGITLLEVLVALFIMGIGLLALLTLFPLGALDMRQVLQEDRAAAGVSALAVAVAAYRQTVGALPASLEDLTPFLGGNDRYADGQEAGYLFRLDGDGTVHAEPAALGKTGIRFFCKPLDGALEDCTPPEALEDALEIQRVTRENLLLLAAEAATDLLLQDPTGQAPRLVRAFLAARPVLEGFHLLDASGDGLVSLREATKPRIQHPVLERYYADVRAELALGAGDEEIDTLPGVGPETFAGDPGMVFTFDTLRFLTRRYAGPTGVGKGLIAHLDAAEAAEQHGRPRARAGLLHAFASQVRAQQGKALSARQALVLITLAATL